LWQTFLSGLRQSVAEVLKVGFEAVTDLIICAVVHFLLALLRSWVQILPGPSFNTRKLRH
jgi:hypothetical protein